MTEQMRHLKCVNFALDNLKGRPNKTNPDSSIILITIFGDYFTPDFCLGQLTFPLCSPQTPAVGVFPSPVPMTGKQE